MATEIERTILSRKTQKILGDPAAPLPVGKDSAAWSNTLRELLQLAAFAPHHYPSHEVHRMNRQLSSIVPWRMYVLDEAACRDLLDLFHKKEIKGGKITRMLAVARALIQVTWLPDPGPLGEEDLFFGNRRNMEHIAAASAAIQNLLLGATAHHIPTYWSSGGKLRDPEFLQLLGIPEQEILLGSVFLFPSEVPGAEVKGGALRGKGGPMESWMSWVELKEE